MAKPIEAMTPAEAAAANVANAHAELVVANNLNMVEAFRDGALDAYQVTATGEFWNSGPRTTLARARIKEAGDKLEYMVRNSVMLEPSEAIVAATKIVTAREHDQRVKLDLLDEISARAIVFIKSGENDQQAIASALGAARMELKVTAAKEMGQRVGQLADALSTVTASESDA